MPRTERVAEPEIRKRPVSWALLLVYNVVWLIGFLFYLPRFVWKMLYDHAYRQGIRERMGHVTPSGDRDVIWVHGVSVGEVKAAAPVVEAVQRALPEVEVIVSSTTPNGRKVAEKLFPAARVVYYPLDFWRFPGRALDLLRPRCVLLMEVELWPNFLHAAERRGVSVAVVNGRISEKSWRRYRWVSWLLPQLDRIDLFSVQNSTYTERLQDLGVSPSKIHTVGNVKYDRLEISEQPVPRDGELTSLLRPEADEAVLVAGSTHADEEARLARVTCELEARTGRSLRLVVAPRHPERSGTVAEDLRRELRASGRERAHAVVRLTERRAGHNSPGARPWLIVDTIGELEKAYSLADVVFVGGSLVRHGGQNMLEPVALGKPTVFGPHVWNFQADVDLLRAGEGVVQVADEESLGERLGFLLAHPKEALGLVTRAQQVLRQNQGATERTLACVLDLLRVRAPDLLE